MLRVNGDNPDLDITDIDVNGNPVYSYSGQLFTGIIEDYENGILIGEYSVEEGVLWDFQRGYYSQR